MPILTALHVLAPLALSALPAADELVSNFETIVDAFVPVDPNATEAVAVGDATAYVTLPEKSGETRLELFDAAGALRWSRAVTSASNPGSYRSLAAADGGSLVVTLTTRGAGPELEFLVEAFDAASGLPAWERALAEAGPFTSLAGELRSGADRLAVRRTQAGLPGGLNSTRVSFLDAASGALLQTSAASDASAPRLFLDPAASLAVLWNRDGDLQAFDPADAAPLWSQFTATLPTSLALGSGATALALGGGGQVLARSDGAGTMAFDAASGALMWTQTQIQARDVVAYDQNTFFAAGMVGFGGADGDHTFGLLDAATGQALWSGTAPLFGAASSAIFLAHVHAAADPAANRVAFARQGLFLCNATTGELLSSTPLDNGPDDRNDLLRLADGKWVAFSASPLFGPVETLQAFAPSGAPLWSVGPTEQELAGNTSVWCDMPVDGATAHSIWGYTNFQPLADGRGRYEVRDATSGELLASWPLPFIENRTFALSPDGSRIAVARIGSSGSSVAVEVRLHDTLTGAVLGEQTLTPNAFTDPGALVWRPDGKRVVVAWESSSGLIVASLTDAGQLQWTRTVYPFSGGNSAADPRLVVDPASGDVFLAASLRESNVDRSLFLTRLRGTNGQILGTNTWNPPDLPGVIALQQPDEARGLFVAPDDDRGYAVVLSNNFDEQLHVVAFELSTLAVAGEQRIQASSEEALILGKGSAVTEDRETLFLASLTDPEGFGPRPLLLSAVELPSLELRWEQRIDTLQSKTGQVALLNDRVAAVATSDFSLPGTVGLIDLADGAVLATAETPDGFGVASFPGNGQSNLAGSQGRLCLVGERSTTVQTASVQVLEAGSLLTTPARLVGGPLNLLLDAQEASAGRSYWFLGSRTGTTPGVALGSVTVPLNLDGYTLLFITKANQPPLFDTFGTLDEQGTARAQLLFPTLPASAFGLTLHHAAITWDPAGFDVDFVTEALPLKIG